MDKTRINYPYHSNNTHFTVGLHSYGIYNYPIIQQILEKNLDHLSEEEQQQSRDMPQHRNIRGSDCYQCVLILKTKTI